MCHCRMLTHSKLIEKCHAQYLGRDLDALNGSLNTAAHTVRPEADFILAISKVLSNDVACVLGRDVLYACHETSLHGEVITGTWKPLT